MQALDFYMGARNPNLGPQVHVTTVLPAKLSPKALPPFPVSDEEQQAPSMTNAESTPYVVTSGMAGCTDN